MEPKIQSRRVRPPPAGPRSRAPLSGAPELAKPPLRGIILPRALPAAPLGISIAMPASAPKLSARPACRAALRRAILAPVLVTLLAALLAGCAGADHAFQFPIGRSADYLIQKFGYPSEVKRSARGAETWVYQTGGRSGSWEYTIKDRTIVNCVYVSHQ